MLERILLTDSLGRHSSMRESLTSSAARGNSCTTSRLVSCTQRRLPGLLRPTYPNPLLATMSQVEVARSAAASPHDPWRPHHNCPQQVLFSSQPPSPCRAVGRGAGQGKIMSQLFKDMNNDTHIRPHESPQILCRYIVR